MRTNFFLFIITALLLPDISEAQKVTFDARICTWYQDKDAAVSVSFDDACFTQFTYAYPVLEKYDIKATFSLVGEWTHDEPTFSAEPEAFEIKKMGWEQLRTLSKHGHELAAHGMHHRPYKRNASTDSLARDMRQVKELIESHTGANVYTIHYPYSLTSDSITKAAQKAGYLFGRTGEMEINPDTPANFYLLSSEAILNDTTPNLEAYKNWLVQAQGKWLILMYHHLFPRASKAMHIMNYHHVRHTYSLFPSTFDKQMQILSASGYWVAPIADVGRYIQERNATNISTTKFFRTYKIKTNSCLNSGIYPVPLSIKVHIPWKKVVVKGSLHDGLYKVVDGTLVLDFMPGDTLIIKKKS